MDPWKDKVLYLGVRTMLPSHRHREIGVGSYTKIRRIYYPIFFFLVFLPFWNEQVEYILNDHAVDMFPLQHTHASSSNSRPGCH